VKSSLEDILIIRVEGGIPQEYRIIPWSDEESVKAEVTEYVGNLVCTHGDKDWMEGSAWKESLKTTDCNKAVHIYVELAEDSEIYVDKKVKHINTDELTELICAYDNPLMEIGPISAYVRMECNENSFGMWRDGEMLCSILFDEVKKAYVETTVVGATLHIELDSGEEFIIR
jgi:hypothetical protein